MSTTRRPVVLLVQQSRDDSLEMYAEFLRYHGLAVIAVSDTRDALVEAPQADIVVTGMNLDDPMDGVGVELVARLRHDDCTRSTPIIVLTACAWPKDRERAEGAGCDVFLLKPCLPNDLLREVWQLLTATRSQAADTPHVFQLPSHRPVRHAHGWPALTGCFAQWQGHRDGEVNEPKEALCGQPCSRPLVTQVGGARAVGERDRVRHRPPCVRALPVTVRTDTT
jgi:two-component system, cell cycle response regulator DivK